MSAGAGHPRRRAAERFRLPVHALEPRDRRPLRLGAEGGRTGSSQVPGLVDVSTDREQGGLQASITIDRQAAARLGVRVQDIDNALNNAFSQRQISDHLHAAQPVSRDPGGRPALPARSRPTSRASSCPGSDGAQVPLTSVITHRQDAGAAGRQPPGPVPGRDRQLRPERRHDAGRGAGRDPPGDRRAPDAGFDPRRGRRRRQGLRPAGQHAGRC